ncbi:MAG: YdeI/OmpD-associated family protein [Gemmatimonadetes bacterium]|nr:YdeI/OmpD-associated family protein [Gemmatimonadota bacterium]
MGTRDPRIDAYIAKSAEFARPILSHFRALVHKAAPDVTETMKWSMPHFDHGGIMCGMAAFKAHAAIGFWKSELIVDARYDKSEEAMGALGRLTTLKDLPPDRVLLSYIKQAVRLNAEGVKAPHMARREARAKKPETRPPADLAAALKKSARARKHWEAFPPSHRREYIEWITSAKQAETRARRLATCLSQVAEGKSQNWKYESKPKKKA